MSDTSIEWAEKSWNPVTGCTKVSEGCRNCYAETNAKRFWGSRTFTDVLCHEDRLDLPLRWRKPRRIFVNSMSDLFHEAVPFEFIDRVIDATTIAAQHRYLVLTKRPERMLEFQRWRNKQVHSARISDRPTWPPNWWLGISAEDQPTLDRRVTYLLQCPAAVRWLSLEPLLGPIDLSPRILTHGHWRRKAWQIPLHWVVVGGESGAKARPSDLAWHRSIRDQCKAAGVAFFEKQLGSQPFDWTSDFDGDPIQRWYRSVGVKGENVVGWPEDLRIREYPR